MKKYIVHKTSGKIWQAGTTIYGLCSAYNHATNHTLLLSDHEHKRSMAYARAIKNRMARLGFRHGVNYHEAGNRAYWPVNLKGN
jgi:hypothetical protein